MGCILWVWNTYDLGFTFEIAGINVISCRWLSCKLWYLQHNCVGDTIPLRDHVMSDPLLRLTYRTWFWSGLTNSNNSLWVCTSRPQSCINAIVILNWYFRMKHRSVFGIWIFHPLLRQVYGLYLKPWSYIFTDKLPLETASIDVRLGRLFH